MKINLTDMSYVIFLKIVNKYRSQEPCASKQKQTYEWESSIETVRHKVQNTEKESKNRQRSFQIYKYRNNFKNFQKVQNSY